MYLKSLFMTLVVTVPALANIGYATETGTSPQPPRLEDLGIIPLGPPVGSHNPPPKHPPQKPEPVLTPEQERARKLAEYGEWCSAPPSLDECVDVIIRVDQEVKKRVAYKRKAGNPNAVGNLGLSLLGCPTYCQLRYFSDVSPQECKGTIATFKRAAQSKPYLWKTDLRQSLKESCGRF